MFIKKFIKIVITLSILGAVFNQVDFHDFSRKLLNLSPSNIFGALFFLILQSLVVSRRWMMILSRNSKTIPYFRILKTHYQSLSSSLILPNILAEPAVKGYLLRKYHVPISEAITSVIIDKLFVLIGLFTLTIATSPIIFTLYPETRHWLSTYVFVLAVLLIVQLLLMLNIIEKLPGKINNIVEKYSNYLFLFKQLLFDEKIILPGLCLSFVSQLFAICAVYILSLAMYPGLEFYECLLLMPPVMLVTAIPVAFNGWGVRELAMIYALGFVNISSEAALALSVQFGTIGLLLWSIGLLFWIPIKGKNYEST